jgi:hypothetical protein
MGYRLTTRVLSALARLALLSCLAVIGVAGCAAGAALIKPATGGPLAAAHAAQAAALLAGRPSAAAASSTYDSLSRVSCSSATNCVSVGGDEDTSLTIAELWNGKAWTATAIPLPVKMHYDALYHVSCPTTTECIAVGYAEGKADYGLAERWNGKAWSVLATPAVMGATLTGISCTTATSCVVVGETSSADGNGHVIAYTWNGTSWTSTEPVEPSGVSFVELNDVACTGSTYCVAAGDAGDNPPFSTSTLIETWNGSKWSLSSYVSEGWFYDGLSGVSCNNAASCFAVGGDGETGGGAAVTSVMHWNGKSWSFVTSPNPDERSQLSNVACVSSADCYAVGTISKSDSSTPWLSLVEHWNGQTWSVVASPSTNFATFLNDVACAGPSTCFAVGSSGGQTGGSATLVEQWNGSHWSIVASPNP